MKKIIIALLLIAFCATSTFAENKIFSGKDWLNSNKNTRKNLVSSFIQDMKKEGVTITKKPVFYCKRMDAFYAKNPNMEIEPAGKILKTLMIMEYDWKIKGTDSDTTAKNWLGDKTYSDNKRRLGKK